MQTRRRPGAVDQLDDSQEPRPARPADAGDEEMPDAGLPGTQ
jgi:hypothetical protein